MAATIRLSDLRLDLDGASATLSARLDAPRMGWHGDRLWFRTPADLAPVRTHGDPFVVALLLPAMAAGLDLVVDGPLSPSLAANLDKVQHMLFQANPRNRWARLYPIRIEAASGSSASAGPVRTGLFFSGGIDSMYSLFHAEEETGRPVDAVLFVHGFDVSLHATALERSVRERLAAAARMAERRLIVVQTNLRRFTDPAVAWDMAHGAGLAAVGHVLGDHFDHWLISASDGHVKGIIGGTARGLEALWSRDGLVFETVGARLDRLRKLATLTAEPLARQSLIVCWQPRPHADNCGRCTKCVSTLLQLLVLDSLERFTTMPQHVDAAMLSADAILADPQRVMLWEILLERLRSRPEWAPLAQGVAGLLDRSYRVQRRPTLQSIASREGRRLAIVWLRRRLQPRLPVAIRRRLLTWYRRRG